MQARVQDDRLATIRAAFPKEGLFAEKEWLLSPDAFRSTKNFSPNWSNLVIVSLFFSAPATSSIN